MPKRLKGEDPTLGGHVGTGVTRTPASKAPIADKTKGKADGTEGHQATGGHQLEVDRSLRARSPQSEIGRGSVTDVDTTKSLTDYPPEDPQGLTGTDQPYEI